MKRIVLWIAATATVLVLLFAYHTSSDRQTAGTTISGASTAGSNANQKSPTTSMPSSSASSAAPSSEAKGSSRSSSASKAHTYVGTTVQTSRGPVAVQITVTTGKITHVSVPTYPDDNPRSQQINDYALPKLVGETMTAQSTKIDMISGATITSQGYLQSLQSALDQAGLR
jgi:uncharacterized protein with FMN-binding domain